MKKYENKEKLTFDEMVDLEADSFYNMDIEEDEYDALYNVDYYTNLKKRMETDE